MPALPGAAKLAGKGPAAEQLPPGIWVPLGSCDATASGAEEAQVSLSRGLATLALCAHHFCGLELALASTGWRIVRDNRGLLS